MAPAGLSVSHTWTHGATPICPVAATRPPGCSASEVTSSVCCAKKSCVLCAGSCTTPNAAATYSSLPAREHRVQRVHA
eukprot:4377617-Pyramimonas_sp.AAC.2